MKSCLSAPPPPYRKGPNLPEKGVGGEESELQMEEPGTAFAASAACCCFPNAEEEDEEEEDEDEEEEAPKAQEDEAPKAEEE